MSATAPTTGELWATVGEVGQLQQAAQPAMAGFQQGMQAGQSIHTMANSSSAAQPQRLGSDKTDSDKTDENGKDDKPGYDASTTGDDQKADAVLAHEGAGAGASAGGSAVPIEPLPVDRPAAAEVAY